MTTFLLAVLIFGGITLSVGFLLNYEIRLLAYPFVAGWRHLLSWWHVDLPQPDLDAPLPPPLESVMTRANVRYARLQPAPDADIWVDPRILEWREDRHQDCAELLMHWSAQADELGEQFLQASEWLDDLMAEKRTRLFARIDQARESFLAGRVT